MSSYLAGCSTELIVGVEHLMWSYLAGCSAELIAGVEHLVVEDIVNVVPVYQVDMSTVFYCTVLYCTVLYMIYETR